MKNVSKFITKYLLVNICILLPIYYLVLSFYPTRIHFVAKTSDSIRMDVSAGTLYRAVVIKPSDSHKEFQFTIPSDASWTSLSLNVNATNTNFKIESFTAEVSKLFSVIAPTSKILTSDSSDLKDIFKGNTSIKIQPLSFVLFIAVQFGLLFMRLMGILTDSKAEKVPVMCSLWLSLAIVAQLFIFLPITAYLGNADQFSFPFSDLTTALILRSIFSLAIAFAILTALTKTLGICVSGISLGFVVCVYLETTIMTIGMPTLTGNMAFLLNHSRIILDTIVWITVTGASIVFVRPLQRNIHWIVISLLILNAAALCDVKKQPQQELDTSNFVVDKFWPQNIIAKNVHFSHEGNILVFILDSITSEEATSVLRDELWGQRLREQFTGFTAYTNNIGMAHLTHQGTTGILTGLYPDQIEKSQDYYSAIFTGTSFLKDALDANMAVFFMPGSFSFGYTNQLGYENTTKEGNVNPFEFRVKDTQEWSLNEVVLFKAVPFALKRYVYRLLYTGWNTITSDSDESVMYGYLQSNKNHLMSPRTFLYCHTSGNHMPIMSDRYGHQLPNANDTPEGAVEKAAYAIDKLGSMFDYLRRMEIYNKSLIIVAADHGGHYGNPSDLSRLPAQAFPFLWVKPINATNEFHTAATPTSHAKIINLLRLSLTHDASECEISDTLYSETRIFRYDRMGEITNWIVDTNGNFTVGQSTLKNALNLNQLHTDSEYSLLSEALTGKPDIQFHNVTSGKRSPYFNAIDKDMSLTFKVNEANTNYSLLLSIYSENAKGALVFSQKNSSTASECGRWTGESKVTLTNLHSNQMGLITIRGVADNFSGLLYFDSIKVIKQ